MGEAWVVPAVGMVLAESAQVGLMMVSKAAMADGMSNLLFIFYSNALASLILLPSSLLFHRSSELPRLAFSILASFFLFGLLGFVVQIFGYAGIYYSSPTLCAAMLNLIPAFTFIFAVTLRMERFNWRSSISLAKLIGTIVALSGALLETFYEGPSLLNAFTSSKQQSTWIFGGMLLLVDAMVSSSLLVFQVTILKKYPAELIMVFFYCLFVTVLSGITCLVVERDLSSWSLESKTRFWAVLYSGAFGSAFQVGVITWCLRRTGPVFVSMFKPLGIVISLAFGVIFMGETFFLGRLLGAIVIVPGFYCVLWAKAKEAKIDKENNIKSLESTANPEPLLQNSFDERRSFVQ